MTSEDQSKEMERLVTDFERENPELARTIAIMGLRIEEYNAMVSNMAARVIVADGTAD